MIETVYGWTLYQIAYAKARHHDCGLEDIAPTSDSIFALQYWLLSNGWTPPLTEPELYSDRIRLDYDWAIAAMKDATRRIEDIAGPVVPPKTPDKDNKVSIRIDCDCHTEILDITYWKNDEPQMYYLTLYKASAMGFFWRLKQAYRYFVYGEFAGNDIVLREEEFNKLVTVLNEHRREINTNG